MSVIGSNILAGASGQGGGYNLTKSLRFRRSASAYLNRTPASASNQQTWTWSGWVKRGQLGVGNVALFGASSGSASFDIVYEGQFGATADSLRFVYYDGSSLNGNLVTTALYRDTSAWYHIVAVWNTTDATPANRMRLYVNGNEITAFSTSSYPTISTSALINNTVAHTLGRYYNTTSHFDGYMAELNFIDGQALTPSSFGQTSTTTGVWIPKKYTGTYGTNGFYLPFTNTTSTSTLGNDFSGNSNTWTVNNISLTAGSTYDSMTDVPTLTSATTANYAVMNPLDSGATNSTLSNGNLTVATASTGFRYMGNTIWATSGKFYAEFTLTATTGYAQVGIATTTTSTNKTLGEDSTSWSYNSWNGTSTNNNSGSSFGNSWTTNDVIGIALDKDNNKLYFSKNGTWQNSADPAAGTGSLNIASIAGLATLIGVCDNDNGGSVTFQVNFGQRAFTYTPPTGFVALNTFNLPTPTIGATASTTANKYMNIALYTGTGSSQSITGLGFQPDWTWIKGRSGATDHGLYDAVRGVQKQLESNNTDAETTETTGLTAFGSDGFTVGALAQLNTSSATYVGWNWKANGAGSSNTAGSITSTVSANTTAGFSIVTYTGNGNAYPTGATVGHGLGVAPNMVIVKSRSTASTNWSVYHSSLSVSSTLLLNDTGAASSPADAFNRTAPTSTVFSVGQSGGGSRTNENTATYVAYCFAEVAGYSKFGSYTGNGSTDGPFIFTGFRPRYLMIKITTTAGYYWMIKDSVRDPYNTTFHELYANVSDAEYTASSYQLDLLSNGFKIKNNGQAYNGSGDTYIYMAFCESPFKFSNAR